jgi:ParB/RepB/Spo0J family partition protein
MKNRTAKIALNGRRTRGIHGANGHTGHSITVQKASALPPTPPSAPEIIQKLLLGVTHVSVLNTRQPKREPGIIELAKSLKTGQTTPAIVRPFSGKSGHFEIGAGSRRRVAAEQPEAGPLTTLDCIVRELSDADFEELILVENLQREDPDPKAEAKLLERYIANGVRTADEISARIGKPKHWVLRRLQLLKVISALRKAWEGERSNLRIAHFSVDMMELLGSLPAALQQTLTDEWNMGNCKDRADLKKYLDKHVLCDLATAPFDLNDPRFFVKGCGPGCASDSNKQTGLFDFDGQNKCGRCLNPGCFTKRLALANAAKVKELTEAAGEESLPVVSKNYCASPVQIGKEEVKPTYNYEAKLGNAPEGAKAVIVLTDDGEFKPGYIPKSESGKATDKKLKSPKQKQEGRIHMLEGKRWDAVRTQLLEALAKTTASDCTEDIVELIAIFGTPWRRGPSRDFVKGVSKHEFDLRNNLWQQYDERNEKGYPKDTEHRPKTLMGQFTPHSLKDCLWEGLKERLKDQVGGIYNLTQTLHALDDMRRISKIITFSIDEKKRAADLQFLPPKSWGPVNPHTLQPIGATTAADAKTATEPDKPAPDAAKPAKTAAKAKK